MVGTVAVGAATVGAATVGVVTVGAATVGTATVGAATVGIVTVGAATVGAVGTAVTAGAMTMATPLAAPGFTTATCPAKHMVGKKLTKHQGSNLYNLIMFNYLIRIVVLKNSNSELTVLS